MIFDEKEDFQNVFAKNKGPHKPEPSKARRPQHRTHKRETMPSHAMPKMQFPKFDDTTPKIWRDNCEGYFELYQLPQGMWITAATIHFQGNAAMWYQACKQTHTFKKLG